jgi:hypothetical protein
MGTGDDAERQRAEAARVTSEVLEALEEVGRPLRAELSEGVTLPEPAVVLDLSSRQGDAVRSVKHLHQMCLLHTMQYRTATRMKIVHLIDAFEVLARAGNGLALYSIARSALELLAQTYDVGQRLEQARSRVTPQNWRSAGEEFFKVIVRARYATSNPSHRELLADSGASKKVLDPMSVGNSIRTLDHVATARNAARRYDDLCDAVHHNLSANTTVSAGSGVRAAGESARGGMLIGPGGRAMPVTAWEYPVVWKADIAAAIGIDFVEDVRTTLELLDRFPQSAYLPEVLDELTGSRLGLVALDRRPDGAPILPPARSDKPGRNEPCPCGSGRKYKLCCGR